MAEVATESIQQVLAALEVFGGKPDKESLDKANAWLQNFQHAVSVYGLVGWRFDRD